MLKNCFLPTKYDCLTNYTCGEIVCQSETSFTIVCKFCDIKIFEFSEFVQHFRNTHWAEISLTKNGFKIEENETPTKAQKQTVVDCNNLKQEDDEQISYEEYNFSDISNDENSSDEWMPQKDDDVSSDSETIAIIKKKLKSNTKSELTFACSFCHLSFTTKSSYYSHIKKHESHQFKCDICSKSFAKEILLTNHLHKHNGYSCAVCPKVFKTYEQLRYHKETHVQTKDFMCDFKDCKKAFATKRRMASHRRLHSSVDLVCEICGSRQRSKQALKDHIRKHSGEKPYACTLCDRRFASKSLLNEHKACHETERRHVCDVCGKSFNRPKALYHHKPLHLGVKKFVCKICGAAYAQAAGLSGHMRKHREDKITNPDTKSKLGNIFNELFPLAN